MHTWQRLETLPTRVWLLEASALLWQHREVWRRADSDDDVFERSEHVLAGFERLLAEVKSTPDDIFVTDDVLVTAYVRTLITRGRHLIARKVYEEATRCFETGLQYLQYQPNFTQSPLIYQLQMPLCICWYVAGRYREIIHVSDQALVLAQHHDDLLFQARLLNSRGLAQRVLGDYQQALINLRSSHALYLRLEHPETMRPMANLASLFHFLGQHEQASRHFEEALAHAKQHGENAALPLLITLIADTHLEGNRLDEALKYYQQAIPALEQANGPQVLAVTLANTALIYSKKHQFAPAQAHLERAQELIALHPHARYNMMITYSLGVFQHNKGDIARAQTTLEDALTQAIATEEKHYQVMIHRILSEVYETRGDLSNALLHARHYSHKNDVLSEQKRQREVAGLLLDIDLERQDLARTKAEYALKVHTELLERITDGFLAIDHQGIITYANHVMTELSSSYQADLNHQADMHHQTDLHHHNHQANLVGKHVADCFPHMPELVRQRYRDASEHKQATTLEFYFDHYCRWYDLRIYPNDVGTTVYMLDITERKQHDAMMRDTHQQLEHAYAETASKVRELEHLQLELKHKNHALERLSQQDGLTKLFNRRTLDMLLSQELQRATRYHDPLSVMLCDIDNFKAVNDQLSHAIGDDVLRHIAMIFSQNTRDHDIVARYGGEEFVIVFPETNLTAAAQVCEHLRHLTANYPWHTIHPDLHVTLSIGVSQKHAHIKHHEHLLQAADAQMYRAKTSGKNRVCFEPLSTEDGSSHNKQT